MSRENGGGLRHPIFEDFEIFFLQAGDGRAVGIGHGGEDVHQLDFDFDRGIVGALRNAGADGNREK